MGFEIKNIIIFFITFFTLNIYAQEEPSVNEPIIFGELILGGAGKINGYGGFLIGGEISYQFKNNLISIRYLENTQLKREVLQLSPVTVFPIYNEQDNNKETSFLFGKRWIYNCSSVSISGGVSLNTYVSKINKKYTVTDYYLGFPFEINVKWFKPKKKKYRIYMLIPVGRPTSFGRNFGFKMVGNLSKNSFIGLALVYGFGIHKKYE